MPIDGINFASSGTPKRAKGISNGNVVLSPAGIVNGNTYNGVAYATGDVILLVDQTTGTENGMYTVPAAAGTGLIRTGLAAGDDASNASVFVVQAKMSFVQANTPGIVGTNALTFYPILDPTILSSSATGVNYWPGMNLQDVAGNRYAITLNRYVPTVTSTWPEVVANGTAGVSLIQSNNSLVTILKDAAANALVAADIGKPVQRNASGVTELGSATAYSDCLGVLQYNFTTTVISVVTRGIVTIGTKMPTGAVPGEALFIDPATPGAYTRTRPSTAGQVACAVGTVINSTTIFVQPIAQAN